MGQVRSEATIGRRGTGEITFHGGKKYVSAPMAPPRTVVGAFGSSSSRELQYPGSSGPAQAFPNTQTAEAKRQREIEERRVSVLPCALGILHRRGLRLKKVVGVRVLFGVGVGGWVGGEERVWVAGPR
jgi:hypothetical protein